MSLTKREELVVRRVADGLTNKEIGDELGVSEQTVKNQVSSAMRKFGVGTRTELAIRYRALDYGTLGAVYEDLVEARRAIERSLTALERVVTPESDPSDAVGRDAAMEVGRQEAGPAQLERFVA